MRNLRALDRYRVRHHSGEIGDETCGCFVRKRVLCVGLAIIAIAAILGAGVLDLQDVHADHSRYCSMVKQGLWPDFKHIYKEECINAPDH